MARTAHRATLAYLFVGVAVGVAVTSTARIAAGQTTPAYGIGFLLITLLAAPLVSGNGSVSAVFGLLLGTAGVWWTTSPGEVALRSRVELVVLLAANVLVVASGVRQAMMAGVSATLAVAAVAFAYLAWFTVPIWSAGSARLAPGPMLIRVHPALVLNGLTVNLGIWAEQPVAYTLTNLGQDAPYALPTSIVPAVIVDGSAAALMALFGWSWRVVCRRTSAARRATAAVPQRPG